MLGLNWLFFEQFFLSFELIEFARSQPLNFPKTHLWSTYKTYRTAFLGNRSIRSTTSS
ncbi:hypothetical protein PXNS11_280013 [Stutzerimonas xanthomarina]|nr:hypothetical protein PXNS11_280013 [Stutzerimonas xanthomarina]